MAGPGPRSPATAGARQRSPPRCGPRRSLPRRGAARGVPSRRQSPGNGHIPRQGHASPSSRARCTRCTTQHPQTRIHPCRTLPGGTTAPDGAQTAPRAPTRRHLPCAGGASPAEPPVPSGAGLCRRQPETAPNSTHPPGPEPATTPASPLQPHEAVPSRRGDGAQPAQRRHIHPRGSSAGARGPRGAALPISDPSDPTACTGAARRGLSPDPAPAPAPPCGHRARRRRGAPRRNLSPPKATQHRHARQSHARSSPTARATKGRRADPPPTLPGTRSAAPPSAPAQPRSSWTPRYPRTPPCAPGSTARDRRVPQQPATQGPAVAWGSSTRQRAGESRGG